MTNGITKILAEFASAVAAGRFYAVRLKDGLLSCDCPVWIFNARGNKSCKHTVTMAARIGMRQGPSPDLSSRRRGWVHPLLARRNRYIRQEPE